MNYMNLANLRAWCEAVKSKWGLKSIISSNAAIRNQYLFNIDYDTDIKFNTDQIVGDAAAPYVGTAVVGSTYVA